MDRPTVLELFAGIGGLSLGLERAGFHVVGQVEIDPFARSILTKHWPEVPKHDDVRTALEWWLSEPRPRVDCVAGGYPCQPESLNGRRRGHEDERWLWPEFARVVHALQPRYVIGENTLGHRTKGLRFVLADLDRLGYTARAGIVRACEMGAPHSRGRVFVVADAEGERREGGTGPRWAAGGRGEEPGWRAGWPGEPDVERVAYGVPRGVDRRRALGNAVVPAVGEFVGHLVRSGAWRDAR